MASVRLLLAALISLVGPAVFAHALVVSSRPAANALVAPGELRIELRFNSRIDVARSRVALQTPDGAERAVAIATDALGAHVTGRADVERTGRWALRWQVLSLDGHVTRGEIPFTVTER
jgi:copper resistance protein C